MKTKVTIFVLFLVLVGFTNAQASGKKITKDHPKYEQIEDNLLVGVNSDNFGLRVSSAYMLGEIQSERAVNPLTKMLREEQHEGARLMAALSLIKIGTERSLYVVKSNIRFNDCARVQNMCARLYKAYLAKDAEKQENDKNILLSFFVEK